MVHYSSSSEKKSMKYGAVGKLISTLIAAVLFFLIGNPFTYELVDKIFGGRGYISVAGCPTWGGVILHTIVFAGILYLIMMPWKTVTVEDY